MSYMDHNDAFVPAGEIQELSFEEIEQINGGILPVLAVVVPVVTAIIGYVAAKSTDDCTTVTREWTNKDGSKTTVSNTTCS